MPSITLDGLSTIKRALMLSEDWDKALEVVKVIEDNQASPMEVMAAINEHGDDECEIDDGASSSRGDEGVWVQAWVWVPYPDCKACNGSMAGGEDGDDPIADCEACAGTGKETSFPDIEETQHAQV